MAAERSMRGTGRAAAGEARDTAQQVAHSKTLERTARVGFLARGFVYVFIGVVAVRIALGTGGGEADQKGAFSSLAGETWGVALLWLIVIGFVGYAVWRIAEATIGHQDEQGGKRTFHRVVSAVKAVIYLGLAWTAAGIAMGGGGGGEGDSWSARIMRESGGRLVVGLVGAVILGAGIYQVVKAIKDDHEEDMQTGSLSPGARKAVHVMGRFGYLARGVAFSVLGVLVVLAAVRADPQRAEGLDVALKTLADAPYGTVILLVVGLGLVAFGCYSFVEARYRRVSPS